MRVGLTLVGTEQETPQVTSYLFTVEASLTRRAEQFLEYTLPHPSPDDRKSTRYLAIVSAAFEQRVMLTTRLRPSARAASSMSSSRGIGITPYRAILPRLRSR
jgi:ferredoxin-NADP reductase